MQDFNRVPDLHSYACVDCAWYPYVTDYTFTDSIAYLLSRPPLPSAAYADNLPKYIAYMEHDALEECDHICIYTLCAYACSILL